VPSIKTHLIVQPRGYRAAESALYLAQFDELSASLWADLAGMTPAELAWQPGKGSNTAGMLLAHMAIVEVFWIQRTARGYKGYEEKAFRRVLGLGLDDDGMPVPKGAGPPAVLRGWTLADYRALHRKARTFAKRAARRFTAQELDRVVEVTRRDGKRMRFNVRWVLYHLLEHFAGHFGQVLLLRHLYRDRRRNR
jgi:uncharacterized damage-inducible protein DinB